MIEGVNHYKEAVSAETLAHLWRFLNGLLYTRIERGAMCLSRSLQDDNTQNEQARYLIAELRAAGLDEFIAFDDVSVVRYDAGSDYVDWHSDGGALLESGCQMGILSLGASRVMEFRKKGDDALEDWRLLEAGDLIVSDRGFQDTHQHRIPPSNEDGLRFSIVMFTHRKKKGN